MVTLITEKKPLSIGPDSRSKLAHKIIEMMQFLRTLDKAVIREIGSLADAAPALDVPQYDVQQIDDKKSRRKTFALGGGSKEKDND